VHFRIAPKHLPAQPWQVMKAPSQWTNQAPDRYTVLMNRRLFRRLAAFLLLGIFAAGGIGLQEFDALFFRGDHEAASRGLNHLDPLGGCGAHSEHCVLAPAATVRSLAAPGPSRVPVVAPVRTPMLGQQLLQPVPADPGLLHTARPPPAAS
jgi:hypothetical protein